MRIDAHIHYTPPARAKNLAQFAEKEPYWGLLLQPKPHQKLVQGWATAERMIEDMDRAGLDKVVIQGEYPRRHETSVARNNQSLDIIRQWPNRVMAFAAIQPKAGPKALAELKRCVEGGLSGVGELNPYAQGHSLDDPDFLRIVEACIDYDIPLNLHVSEEVGHYYPGKSTTPLRHYYHLAQRYPELKLILAHWGGGLIFYELMSTVRRDLKNVWYDTAASPLLYPTKKIFKVALACIDHRKILYGSDYPLLICPRRQTDPDFRPFLAEIDELELDREIYADVMGRNMVRLLEGGEEKAKTEAKAKVKGGDEGKIKRIEGALPVRLVVQEWPETREIFEKFGIQWQDSPVPAWEPIAQAAAAQGWGPKAQRRLLDELNRVVS